MPALKRHSALAAATLILVACAPAQQDAGAGAPAPAVEHTAPAGRYVLDRSHSTLIFRVNHIGYSMYVGAFEDFDATLDFDPEHPAAMRVEASVNLASVRLPAPPEGFRETLLGAAWLGADENPVATFRSTAVALTGPSTADVAGELWFRGHAHPATLQVRFNGGYDGFPPYDPQARIGFSVHGTLNRSDWAMTEGLPPVGSAMGVFDAVEILIETEFQGPPVAETGE